MVDLHSESNSSTLSKHATLNVTKTCENFCMNAKKLVSDIGS